VRAGAAPAGGFDGLLVSDLPLQGGLAFSAQQMKQAILFTLRAHGFKAGQLRLGYQSCDDSVARTGLFDSVKCAANARSYGESTRVLAVVSFVNSRCGPVALHVPPGARVSLTRIAFRIVVIGGAASSRRLVVLAAGGLPRSDRSSASSPDRHAAGTGQTPLRALTCAELRPRRACDGASLRISCDMPTPLRWPARACR